MLIRDLKDGTVFISVYSESKESGVFLSYVVKHVKGSNINTNWTDEPEFAEATDICILSGDGVVEEEYTITNESVFRLLYEFDEATSLKLQTIKSPQKYILDLYPEIMI